MSKGLYINDKLVATIGLSGKVVTSIYDVDAGKEIWSKEEPSSNNKIYYTSTDGNIVTPYDSSVFGATLLSNTYKGGQGVITFDGDVTTIGGSAFKYCSGLKSITIPDSVISIGGNAFFYCTGLTSIVVDSENTVYDSRNNCNAIIQKSNNQLIAGCKNTVIPDGVTTIDTSAFYRCTGLTSISIPDSVTTIGAYAFSGCTGLTSITIGSGVTTIGNTAFSVCTGLTSITIPDSVTTIGNNAFSVCTGLTSISIPDSVTTIGSGAFSDCTGLTSISIPDSVISIGNSAFSVCTNLKSITCKATTAPTVNPSTFGISETYYTGRNTYNTGTNTLKVPSGATGYNTSYWADPLLDSTKCGFHIEYIEEPSTDKTITFNPSEYTYDARYSIDGGDDVYVEEGTTATIVLPDTSTTISFNCQKGIGDWYINGVEKADQMSRPWVVNVADLNDGDIITCDISS